MKKSHTPKYFSILALTLICLGCGPSYNTEFDTPNESQPPQQAFPSQIDTLTPSVSAIPEVTPPQIGFQAVYGNNFMQAQIIKSPDEASANNYFKDTIVPKFDAMSNHSRAEVNGKWYASGTDSNGRIWYGWVNKNWSFVISADTQEHFDKLVEDLPYISK